MAKNGTATAKKILASRTDMLKVPLTETELKEVAEQTYRIEGDLRSFYAHKKEVTADLKAKEERLDGDLARLGRLGRDKCEYRPVPVRVEADYKAGRVFEIREDTGETIGERPLNEQDRQAPLFAAPPPAEPPPSQKAKELEQAALEKKADDILANAGDGKLNEKELKGPPEARKRARARG